MSSSSISPLAPVTPDVVMESTGNVSIAQSGATLAAGENGSVVELSQLALQQNVEQLALQNQISLLNNAQENAIKHLEFVAATNNASTHRNSNDQLFAASLTRAETLLNTELQTVLSSEALVNAIAAENAATSEATANQVFNNADSTTTTSIPTPASETVHINTPSPATTNYQTNSNTNAAALGQITTLSSQTTPVSNTNQEAALTTSNIAAYAEEMINSPAVAAAIAAYHLSDGMITDRSNKSPDKIKNDKVTIKGIALLDPIEKIGEDDADQQARREIPWIWKRVLKIKNKLMLF